MQPESNEEREAWDVRHIRRMLGIPDDTVAPEIDAAIRYHRQHHHYYERIALEVKLELGVSVPGGSRHEPRG